MMVVLNFVIIAIVCGHSVSLNLTPNEFPFLKTQMNDEKHALAFNKLLNSIVKSSQKRLEAIKKLNKLQATDVHPSLEDSALRSLRTRRDSDESDESSDETKVIYLIIPDQPNTTTENKPRAIEPSTTLPPDPPKPKPERTQPKTVPTVEDHDLLKASNSFNASSIQSISKSGLDALRVSIARSCKNREVKRCKNACYAAIKSACEEYSCKKKLKKKLKKSCKRECKEEFRNTW